MSLMSSEREYYTMTDPMVELKAMTAVAEALAKLDTDATGRVIRWAADCFGVAAVDKTNPKQDKPGTGGQIGGIGGGTPKRFEHLGDLYSAASPEKDSDRALVVGYWHQFIEEQADFGAQTINSALKNLGHGVANITVAFEALKAQKPQLVIQLKKSGTSKQARKTYKLTAAGKSAVEMMIADQQ